MKIIFSAEIMGHPPLLCMQNCHLITARYCQDRERILDKEGEKQYGYNFIVYDLSLVRLVKKIATHSKSKFPFYVSAGTAF